MAAYAELSLDQGTDYSGYIVLTEDDGSVINVANSVFTCQLRKSYYSANASANLTMTVVGDGSTGNVSLGANAAYTATIKAGRYLYDIIRTDADSANQVTRIVEGIITVNPRVTQ